MSNHLRGHAIEFVDGSWRYVDTGEPTEGAEERPCGKCGESRTPEGHDACLGTLPGVMNACCGHGDDGDAYVQYSADMVIRGSEAVREFGRLLAGAGR